MFVTIWEYEVRPGMEAAFEALCGPDGAWVALFREYPGYPDTKLLRSDPPRHCLSIDRLASAADYGSFLSAAGVRYARIDARGDTLTLTERCTGRCGTPC